MLDYCLPASQPVSKQVANFKLRLAVYFSLSFSLAPSRAKEFFSVRPHLCIWAPQTPNSAPPMPFLFWRKTRAKRMREKCAASSERGDTQRSKEKSLELRPVGIHSLLLFSFLFFSFPSSFPSSSSSSSLPLSLSFSVLKALMRSLSGSGSGFGSRRAGRTGLWILKPACALVSRKQWGPSAENQ